MIDPSKPIKVGELLEDLDILHEISQNYILMIDSSIGGTFLKMIDAINAVDEHGWEIVSITHAGDGMSMYALARRITKVKNQL